jgi:hypothetical protein
MLDRPGTKMGDAGDLRQGESVYRPIVAFDFDGTLTVRDSFTAFLQWRVGPAAWWAGWARLAPALARYVRDRDRGRLKAAAIGVFLGGTPRVEIEDAARRFAEGHARRLLRPDALRAWARWREQGARTAGHRHRQSGGDRPALRPRPRRGSADRHAAGL